LSAPADVALKPRAVEQLGAIASAPIEHPLAGAVEVRWIAPGRLPDACRVVRDAGYFFESLTCVDRIAAHGAFELIYTFNRFESPPPSRVVWRVWSPAGQPVPTVRDVFGAAVRDHLRRSPQPHLAAAARGHRVATAAQELHGAPAFGIRRQPPGASSRRDR
jgi:hypothetical protein